MRHVKQCLVGYTNRPLPMTSPLPEVTKAAAILEDKPAFTGVPGLNKKATQA